MSEIAFGIDLGTSTSVVSFIKQGRPVTISDPHTKSPLVPSIIAMNRRGELVVGQSAEEEGLPDQKIREAKRSMGSEETYQLGDQALSPEEVAAVVLKKVKENAETALGEPLTKAVITVPAYFDDLPRRATERAARLAGIEPIRLISEPVAAAMAYGLERLDDEAMLLVFDLGGGTLDVTILEMMAGVLEVKATDGDKELGGKDMDDMLMQHVIQKAGFEMPAPTSAAWDSLKKKCEAAKKALSSNPSADVYVQNFSSKNGELVDLDVSIGRTEFEEVIQPLLDRAIDKLKGSLEKAKLTKDKINRLLLVGGACYVPRVREVVETFFALKAESGVDPDLAVSQGAAISAGLRSGEIDSQSSIVVQDAATFRMGTSAITRVGGQDMLMFSELMPANAPVPFVRTVRYSLTRLDQDEVEIDVLQDRSSSAVFSADAIPTGATGVIKDIPPSTTDTPREIDIELRLDESHIIRITGKVIGIDRAVTIQLNSDLAKPNPLQAMDGASAVDDLWEKSPLASRNSALIRRAETVLEGKPDSSERIEAALVDLKQAVANNNSERAQIARERLTDHLSEMND